MSRYYKEIMDNANQVLKESGMLGEGGETMEDRFFILNDFINKHRFPTGMDVFHQKDRQGHYLKNKGNLKKYDKIMDVVDSLGIKLPEGKEVFVEFKGVKIYMLIAARDMGTKVFSIYVK